jgi:D-2-hydroxyacid dehydrogenase (NADP+)
MKAFVELNSSAAFMDIGKPAFAPMEKALPQVQFEYLGSYDELKSRIAEPHLIFCWRFAAELYPKATNLKAVFTPSAGKEHVAADPRGKVSVSYGSYHGKLMAETLVGMVLYFNAHLGKALAAQAAGRWDRMAQWPNRRLACQHVLIIGYGTIGRYVARLLRPFGCSVSGLQRTHASGVDPETGVRYVRVSDLTDELRTSDHVVLILPSTTGTSGILGRAELSAMKPTAHLYNIGRGNAVSEADLVWALTNSVIAGAGLDVFDPEPLPASSPLWRLANVMILPHTSACYEEYGPLFVEEAIPRVREVLAHS